MAKVGRPRIIESPEEFIKLANAYFSKCDKGGVPYSVTGLALGLGLSSRDSLMEYERRDEFSDTVKMAKMVVENSYEISLRGGCHPSGPIFALKNFGWKDKTDHELTGPNGAPLVDSTPNIIVNLDPAAVYAGSQGIVMHEPESNE